MPIEVQRPKRSTGKSTKRNEEASATTTPKSELYKRVPQNGDLLDVPIEDISPNPFNDREMRGLEEMAASISEVGLLSPVLLLHTDTFAASYPEAAKTISTKYVLGPGEHRWRASQMAGLTKIRGFLRDDLAPRIRATLLLENLQRTDPSPMEFARKISQIQEEDGLSVRDIAKIIGSGPTTVQRHLELLRLPPDVQEAVHNKDLRPSHARRLLELGDSEQIRAAWTLMREQDHTVSAAVHAVMSGKAVPQGNTEPATTPNTGPSATGTSPDAGTGSEQEDGTDTSDRGEKAAPETGAPVPQPRSEKTAPKEAAPGRSSTAAPPGPTAAERHTAATVRDEVCRELLATDEYASPDQVNAAVARALLTSFQQKAAQARAHQWLRRSGRAEFDISDSPAYHQAVLSSGNQDLVNRVVFATALAAAEIRASDRRRHEWDRQDVAHVHLLIAAAGYEPQTDWERAELRRHSTAVPQGNSSG